MTPPMSCKGKGTENHMEAGSISVHSRCFYEVQQFKVTFQCCIHVLAAHVSFDTSFFGLYYVHSLSFGSLFAIFHGDSSDGESYLIFDIPIFNCNHFRGGFIRTVRQFASPNRVLG